MLNCHGAADLNVVEHTQGKAGEFVPANTREHHVHGLFHFRQPP